jgi:hypothetical protein
MVNNRPFCEGLQVYLVIRASAFGYDTTITSAVQERIDKVYVLFNIHLEFMLKFKKEDGRLGCL